jgi:hypothetical protein
LGVLRQCSTKKDSEKSISPPSNDGRDTSNQYICRFCGEYCKLDFDQEYGFCPICVENLEGEKSNELS